MFYLPACPWMRSHFKIKVWPMNLVDSIARDSFTIHHFIIVVSMKVWDGEMLARYPHQGHTICSILGCWLVGCNSKSDVFKVQWQQKRTKWSFLLYVKVVLVEVKHIAFKISTLWPATPLAQYNTLNVSKPSSLYLVFAVLLELTT